MLYTVVLPILLLFVPWLLVRFVFRTNHTKSLAYKTHAPYLWVAAALWVLAFILPDVHISTQTDTFTMHTIGGVIAALLFVYATKAYKIHFAVWWQAWVGLYLFASGLGVLNELFEFFLDTTKIAPVIGGDEWWDLLANTIGASMGYVALVLLRRS